MSVEVVKNSIVELKKNAKTEESFERDLESILKIFSDISRVSAINEIRVMANADGVPAEVKAIVHGLGNRVVEDPIRIPEMQGEIIESLSEVEHVQWEHWSKSVAPEVSEDRRKRWEGYWVPYAALDEKVKDFDRIWARKAWVSVQSFLAPFMRERENKYWNTVVQAVMLYDRNPTLTESDLEDFASYLFEYVSMMRRAGYEGDSAGSDADREG